MAMADGSPAPKNNREARFHELSDGALSNPKAERLALLLADEVPINVAWRLLDGRNEGGSLQYRKKMEAHPAFQKRLMSLKAQREEDLKDDLFGSMKWMAAQLWREARAKGDGTMLLKAADLQWKITEKEVAFRSNSGGEVEGVAPPAGRPGKPSVQNPQTEARMGQIRDALLQKRPQDAPGGPSPQAAAAPEPVESTPAEPEPMPEFNLEAAVGGIDALRTDEYVPAL